MDAKTKIIEACQWARDKGLKIVPNEWSVFRSAYTREWKSEDGQCCPLGAVLLKEQTEIDHESYSLTTCAAYELGVSEEWVDQFIAGVDNRRTQGPAVDFGRDVIRQFSDWYALPEEGECK